MRYFYIDPRLSSLVEVEPRSVDVASPEEEPELDFDDGEWRRAVGKAIQTSNLNTTEPRSDDSDLESEEVDFDDGERLRADFLKIFIHLL